MLFDVFLGTTAASNNVFKDHAETRRAEKELNASHCHCLGILLAASVACRAAAAGSSPNKG